MRAKAKYFDFNYLSNDLMASFVVFLVALPLALGIALASGAPLMAGIISSVVGGMLAGLFAGAPLQVSGPAAGLTVIVFSNIQRFGFRSACVITIICGVSQILIGIFRKAKYALAIPPAVIHAMLAGIGILIAFSQIQIIWGLEARGSFYENLQQLLSHVFHPHLPSLFVGAGIFVFLHLWRASPYPRLRKIPGPLVGIILFTLVSMLFSLDVKRVEITGSFFSSFQLPLFNFIHFGHLLTAGMITALIASAESLLSAVATDKLHDGAKARLDQEIIAQGIGNTVCGLIGGIPITGVIVRTAINISADAKTRLSSVLHAVWLFIFVVLFGGLLHKIPMAALAGLLVFIGLDLINIRDIREAKKHGEFKIYLSTLAGVVGLNLLEGVVIGMIFAANKLFRALAKPKIKVSVNDSETNIKILGPLTFASTPFVRETLEMVTHNKKTVINVYSTLIDHASRVLLEDWQTAHERDGTCVEINYHQLGERA